MPLPRYDDPGRNGDSILHRIPQPVPVLQGTELRLTATEKQRRHRAGIRTGTRGVAPMKWAQPRNGLPVTPHYSYRARSYPQAMANIAAAEAQHGPPAPTCYCGAPIGIYSGRPRRCAECGRAPHDAAESASA